MPVVPHAGAMKIVRPAFRHHGDGAAGVAPELGRVVGGEDFQFLNRIDVGLIVHGAVGPGIEVGDSVDCEIDLASVIAVDGDSANGIGGGYVAVPAAIDNTRDHGDEAEQIATFQG